MASSASVSFSPDAEVKEHIPRSAARRCLDGESQMTDTLCWQL
jgi:hypothetical protein